MKNAIAFAAISGLICAIVGLVLTFQNKWQGSSLAWNLATVCYSGAFVLLSIRTNQ